ncbi:CapA family protein [Bacillus sp. AFS088145]|uniref:CapA family protein n=1 Tax=Bacillus sp. AFS088145 TaxID=2033514 RepID=UPI000BF2B871|nr:CapA family protein [Bacillus sp. AFS088145]PFH91370.1 capsular biosynthesis protein [Bacillus sp. AFS088145]
MSQKRKKTSRRKIRIKRIFSLLIFLVILFVCKNVYSITFGNEFKNEENPQKNVHKPIKHTNTIKAPPQKPIEETIKISAAGDFTLGTDESFNYSDSFVDEAKRNGLHFFVDRLNNIFNEDDFTTVNLETTLTNATDKAVKKYKFKGDPSYANILKYGGIDAVNLANNHSHDYLKKGYDDTISNLKKYKIGYFGYSNHYLTTVKGIKIGALGYEGWNDTPELRVKIANDIGELRNAGAKVILIHFHWGIEREYVPNNTQKSLAHYAVDHGADLILGHHPHVLQGIEEYNGKFIVYSLGNFMFGGNRNPSDKDTIVFQQTFHFQNGKLTNEKELKVIPFSISSVSSRNNYQPKLLDGPEKDRVKNKVIDISEKISRNSWTMYEK